MTQTPNHQPSENTEVTPWDLVTAVEDADEPLHALEAIGLLHRWLDDAEDDFVVKAQIEGASWSQIGVALGRSKQAVWQKHRDPEDAEPTEED